MWLKCVSSRIVRGILENVMADIKSINLQKAFETLEHEIIFKIFHANACVGNAVLC